MPSQTPRQHRFMEMVAHNPGAARRVGVPQPVGQDFAAADQHAGYSPPMPKRAAKQQALIAALRGGGR